MHIILRALAGDKHLCREVRDVIESPDNEIFYSTVSAQEIEIKHLKRNDFKLSADQFVFLCD